MRGKRAYAIGETPGLAPAFVRRRPLSSAPTPEQHPSKMHRLAVRRLSVNAFPKRPGASPASDGLLSRRWRLGRRVDGVRDGPYRLDAVDAAPPPPREKENKKNTGANFIPLTPLAFIDRARHVFADGPAVVDCVEINQCVGCTVRNRRRHAIEQASRHGVDDDAMIQHERTVKF